MGTSEVELSYRSEASGLDGFNGSPVENGKLKGKRYSM